MDDDDWWAATLARCGDGALGGFWWALATKAALLDAERLPAGAEVAR